MSTNKLLNRYIKPELMERRNCAFCGDHLKGRIEFCSDFCKEAAQEDKQEHIMAYSSDVSKCR